MSNKWQYDLQVWRKERNITAPSGKFVEMIEEEIEEYKVALRENNEHERIDAIADIIVFAVNELALEGYCVDAVMHEVVKEISSRNQNPRQKDIWEKWGADGKWLKDKDQPKETLYKAKFVGCKL